MTAEIQSNRLSSNDSTAVNRPTRNRRSDNSVQQGNLFDELLRMPLFDAKIQPVADTVPVPSEPAPKKDDAPSASSEDKPIDKPKDEKTDANNAAVAAAVEASKLLPIQDQPKAKHDEHSDDPIAKVKAASKKKESRDDQPQGKVSAPKKGDDGATASHVDAKQTIAKADAAESKTLVDPKAVQATGDEVHPTLKLNETAAEGKIEDAKQVVAPGSEAKEKRGKPRSQEASSTNDLKVERTDFQPNAVHEKPVVAKNPSEGVAQDKQAISDNGANSNADAPTINRRSERLAEKARGGEHRKAEVDDADANARIGDAKPIEPANTASTAVPVATPSVPPDFLATNLDNTSSSSVTTVTPSIAVAPAPTVVAANPVGGAGTKSDVGAVSATQATNAANSLNAANAGLGSNGTTTVSTGRSSGETSRTGSAPSLTPYQETKLVQRVLRGLEQLSNGGGQVRLRLHPPELGSLQMTLRIEGNSMNVKMEVENSAARDTLVQNMQVLKDRLADQGIQVEQFEVQVSADQTSLGSNGQPSQNGNQSGSSQERDNSRYVEQLSNRIPSAQSPTRVDGSRTPQRNGALDLMV